MSYKKDIYIAMEAAAYNILEDSSMLSKDITLQQILIGANMFRKYKYYGDDVVVLGWKNAVWWDDVNDSVEHLKAIISSLKKYNLVIFGEDYDDNIFVAEGDGFKPLNIERTISLDGEEEEY